MLCVSIIPQFFEKLFLKRKEFYHFRVQWLYNRIRLKLYLLKTTVFFNHSFFFRWSDVLLRIVKLTRNFSLDTWILSQTRHVASRMLWGLEYTIKDDGLLGLLGQNDVLLCEVCPLHKEGMMCLKRPFGYPLIPTPPFLIENCCSCSAFIQLLCPSYEALVWHFPLLLTNPKWAISVVVKTK